GVVASVQPYHAVADRDKAERYWGARHRRSYAYQRMHEAGGRVSLGAGVPVGTWGPLRVVHAPVLGCEDHTPARPAWLPDQALSMTEALWAYTVGGAYAGGQEARQGSVALGQLADLVVLEEDPLTIPPERIMGAQVAATLVGGEVVHGTLE